MNDLAIKIGDGVLNADAATPTASPTFQSMAFISRPQPPSIPSVPYTRKRTILSEVLPESVYLYVEVVRLEKPTGIILAFWPFSWGVGLAAPSLNASISLCARWLAIFLLGSILLRSTACTLNDILDRKIDREVARTKNRPIASGRLPVLYASAFLVLMYALCVGFFLLLDSTKALYLGLFSLFPLVSLYPLFKRVTYWPQAWLGLTANWGLLIAYLTLRDKLDFQLLFPLFGGAWCWTMHYDTIYACQDKTDDAKAGVGSTALKFGIWIKPILALLSCGFITSLAHVGYVSGQGWFYYLPAVGGTAAHLTWQLVRVDLNDPASCGAMFRSNSYVGAAVFVGLALDYVSGIRVL